MKKAAPLPDLDDDADFRRRLSPLLETVLPDDRRPGGSAAEPETRNYVQPEPLNSVIPDNRRTGLVHAAETQAKIETVRGAKKRFEYLIPERVGRALAEDAAARGISATSRLLEVLRDAGYPVIQEDMVDLRKMPKR